MRMTRVLYGLAALPLLAGVALAETPQQTNGGKALAKQPMQLTEQQMDKVTAGWQFLEIDTFNTGFTIVAVYLGPNTLTCPTCYLLINNFAISVASQIGR
jgi:hypothetical protein